MHVRATGQEYLALACDLLARHGASRVKIGFETDRARRLSLGIGFEQGATVRAYAGSLT